MLAALAEELLLFYYEYPAAPGAPAAAPPANENALLPALALRPRIGTLLIDVLFTPPPDMLAALAEELLLFYYESPAAPGAPAAPPAKEKALLPWAERRPRIGILLAEVLLAPPEASLLASF